MQFEKEREKVNSNDEKKEPKLKKKTTLNMNDYKAFKKIKNISARYTLG